MTNFTSHLDKALGFDGAAKMLADKGINALNEEFRKRGEQAKAKKPDGKEGNSSTPDEAKDWEPLLSEILEAVDQHQSELDALKQADEARVKARAETDEATTKRIKALEDDKVTLTRRLGDAEKALKAIKEDTPRRASEASETKLSETEEKEAKEKIDKRTQEFDPAFPGMNVPLKTP